MNKIVYFISIPFLIFASGVDDGGSEEDMIDTHKKEEGHKHLSLSIVQGDGSLISLSDGSLYHIDPKYWDVSSGWIANPADVSIEDTKDGSTYPLVITNKATGTSVRAVKALQEELSSE
jgi:hypothetical protein